MKRLSMCRICLVEDVKMYSLISSNLQELYERLTDMPFVTKDKKPVQVCYLCCARLQNCHRLQATCLKSEEILNKVMANNELKQIESQDLNTLKTVHPLIRISCVPSMRKNTDDDKFYENNDVKFDPLEITPDAQIKDELYEDDLLMNGAVDIKSEVTVEDEDIFTEDGDMSNNSHTMQDTQLEHDIQLKPVKIVKSDYEMKKVKSVKIVLERIDLEQFKIGTFAAKNSKIDCLNGNTESNISIDTPESEVTVLQNKNIEKKIQTIGRAVIVENKNIVKPFIDNTCSGVHSENNFTHKRNLISHTQHMGGNGYRCEVCEKSFTVRARLVNHIRIHTGERPFRCVTCNHSFAQKANLVSHTTRVHTGQRSYICNVCEKSFFRKSCLVVHSRKHTGERPYNCITCNRSFSFKGSLVNHTRIHTGDRPHICNTCGKSFTRKSILLTHTRIHTGEKPYKCIICNQSFSWKGCLVKHTRIHTGESPQAVM